MNTETLNQQITLVKKQSTFKIVIPDKVESKIRFICNKIWKDEWSGTLFYKYKGSFEDESLEIICEDIFVMDIGTAAYTEFDMSPDVISYMTEHPELLDCQMGLIHSHNQMATFFSGTDLTTLTEEGIDRNHFVSLIVNNEGKYTAAITRRVNSIKNITEEITYKSFDDIEKKSKNSYNVTSCEIEYFYLNIEFETSKSSNEELSLRLNTLYETKKKKETFESTVKASTSVQQGFLFPNKEEIKKYKQTVSPNKIAVSSKSKTHIEKDMKEDEEDSIPYEYIKFDSQIIKSVVIQLITGSIILTSNSKVDIDKWMQKMSIFFEKRFGKGDIGFKAFKNWAESYIDYIVWYTEDDSLINMGYTDDELSAICAYDIIEELEKLPANKYVYEYINILNSYLI